MYIVLSILTIQLCVIASLSKDVEILPRDCSK